MFEGTEAGEIPGLRTRKAPGALLLLPIEKLGHVRTESTVSAPLALSPTSTDTCTQASSPRWPHDHHYNNVLTHAASPSLTSQQPEPSAGSAARKRVVGQWSSENNSDMSARTKKLK